MAQKKQKEDNSYWLNRGIKQEKKLMILHNKLNKKLLWHTDMLKVI